MGHGGGTKKTHNTLMNERMMDGWGNWQGYLDEQFVELEELQDEANPKFVEEIVTLFYTDSARLVHNIEQAL